LPDIKTDAFAQIVSFRLKADLVMLGLQEPVVAGRKIFGPSGEGVTILGNTDRGEAEDGYQSQQE
jgi:hypothetical protein